jgi:hypothetical protein
MQDFETFQEALATHRSTTDDEGAPTYMNSLMNSMSLVLDEFYKHLKVCIRCIYPASDVSLSQAVGVSSLTGDGVAEFFEAVEASREEYEKSVTPNPITVQGLFDRLYHQRVPSRASSRACAARGNTAETKRRFDSADDGGPCSRPCKKPKNWTARPVELARRRRGRRGRGRRGRP